MKPLSKVWWLLGGLVLAGVMFTFWDYRNYQKIETINYGHGPGEKAVTWKIDQLYQNEAAKVRIKYPIELKIINSDIVGFEGEGVKISLKVKPATGMLKDWEDKEIAGLAKNEQMYGERSYENTERVNMTVINLQRFEGDKTYMVSRYLAMKYNRLYTLEFVTELGNWQKNEGNFKEMARSLVLL